MFSNWTQPVTLTLYFILPCHPSSWLRPSNHISAQVIFCSSDDPKFGCTSLGNGDALWSSSKDFSCSPEKHDNLSMEFSTLGSGASSISEQCGNTEDMLDHVQPFATRYDNVSDLTCRVPQNGRANMNGLRHTELKNSLFVEDKVYTVD